MDGRTEVDGLLERGLGKQARSVADTTGSRDDLSSTTVNSISVKGNIEDVDTDTTHVLVSHGTFLGGPLEGSNARILDFVEVLHTLRDIDEHVRASGVRTEAPDLAGIGDVPAELVGEDARPDLVIVAGVDLAGLDGLREGLVNGHRLGVETVVLVLRLGEGDNRGLSPDGLTVGDDRVGDLEGNTSVVLLEIL